MTSGETKVTASVDVKTATKTNTTSVESEFHAQATTTSASATADKGRASYFTRHITPELPQIDPHTAQVIWRDIFFIMLGFVSVSVIGFVETRAMDADARFLNVNIAGLFHYEDMPANPFGIVDTGYIVTYPLYTFLKENRDWNDFLALLNSLALVLPTVYATYVTVWLGDYSCVFRILALQLLRACCGWMTYLPPDVSVSDYSSCSFNATFFVLLPPPSLHIGLMATSHPSLSINGSLPT